MPIHDWTRVESGIFHAFHHEWISEMSRALNRGLLPSDYYALPEQQAAGFGPDVLTLQDLNSPATSNGSTTTVARPRPKTRFVIESPAELHRRKKSSIAVRHVSGDRVVAVLEIVSPGNKDTAAAFRSFVSKACEFLDLGVHLLLIDPFPAGKRDPDGIHPAIWKRFDKHVEPLPAEQPLTLVAYEAREGPVAYIERVAVGEPLPDMPLFLAPDLFIDVPLERTYMAAWETVPARWQRVIQP